MLDGIDLRCANQRYTTSDIKICKLLAIAMLLMSYITSLASYLASISESFHIYMAVCGLIFGVSCLKMCFDIRWMLTRMGTKCSSN